jgi:hypothetical protein
MKKSCNICAGKLIEIRGRYPKDPRREVCPTCLADRMDMIREMSALDYGIAYESIPLSPVILPPKLSS